MNKNLVLSDFKTLFQGEKNKYGQHIYGKLTPGKKEKDGKSWTVPDMMLTDQAYKDHLSGQTGLGIIPIDDKNRCKFVVIDVDLYEKGREQIVITAIQNNSLPLTVFKSKSGGYHLYIFFDVFIQAKEAVKVANRFIRLLSIDILCSKNKEAIEIFPKQTQIKPGQTGNWINLPYWNCESTVQTMIHKGKEIGIEEALLTIREEKIISLKEINEFLDGLWYNSAPPCLQSIFYLGQLTDNRNNYLFSFGVYFKKVNEDNFEHKIYEINNSLNSPLSDKELEKTVISSVRKKGYGYRCKEQPCAVFCNKTECKVREFGIGDGKYVTELSFEQIYRIKTDPPYYEWDIDDTRIRFKDEDEILNQNIFRKKCMRSLNHAPYKLKDSVWIKIVNDALSNIIEEKLEENTDISPGAMLQDLFADFILNRALANSKDEIFMGRVFYDDTQRRYLFRGKDLVNFIFIVKQFKYYSAPEIHAFLRDIKCKTLKTSTETRKQLRLFAVDTEYFEKKEYYKAEDIIPVMEFQPEQIIKETKDYREETKY